MASLEDKQTPSCRSRHSRGMQNLNSLEEYPMKAAFALNHPSCVARDVAHGSITKELTFDMVDSLSLPSWGLLGKPLWNVSGQGRQLA